jgi:4-hydroxy-L-threonine phosphate dehydrogenase PdxA
MNYKPIVIVAGEPNSVFFELFFKVIKKKIKSPIILIASKQLITKQAKILKKKINFTITDEFKIIKNKNILKKINLINVDFNQSLGFKKITPKSNHYISTCFDIAIKLLENNVSNKFINGPISKQTFLKKNIMELLNILPIKPILKNLQ